MSAVACENEMCFVVHWIFKATDVHIAFLFLPSSKEEIVIRGSKRVRSKNNVSATESPAFDFWRQVRNQSDRAYQVSKQTRNKICRWITQSCCQALNDNCRSCWHAAYLFSKLSEASRDRILDKWKLYVYESIGTITRQNSFQQPWNLFHRFCAK